jgi:hypothetical protein
MNRVIVSLGVSLLFILSATATSAQRKQAVFDTLAECQEAYENNTFAIYQSRYRNNAGRVVGLPTTYLRSIACVRQDVVGGVGKNAKWTVQDTTIQFSLSGGQIAYRTDCGNRVYEVVYLEEEVKKQVEVVKVPVEKIVTVEKTVEVPGPCVPGQPQVTEETINGKKATVTRDGCNTVVEYKQKKGFNPYLAAAIGAGGMYAACQIGKFCGTRTKKVIKYLPPPPSIPIKGPGSDGNPPRVPPGTRSRTTGDNRQVGGSGMIVGTVPTRRTSSSRFSPQSLAKTANVWVNNTGGSTPPLVRTCTRFGRAVPCK